MSASFTVDIPIPDAAPMRNFGYSEPPHYEWSSEKECHQWLLHVLRGVCEMDVFDEPRLVDIYGHKARADIGVVVHRASGSFFFVIELKHRAALSTNASDAFIQAYHYREMCVVDDDRLPGWVNGNSPTFAFAGVFPGGGSNFQKWRCDGMGILSANMKVGNILGNPLCDRIFFMSGTMRLFTVPVGGTSQINWQTTADAYLFGKERRNGGRRDRQTVAEKFFEMQQTFKELF